MSTMDAAAAGTDHDLLLQISFPSRRDYQLRSYASFNATVANSGSTTGAVVAAGHASSSNSPNPLSNLQLQQRPAATGVLLHQESCPVLSVNANTCSAENPASLFSGSLRDVNHHRGFDNLRISGIKDSNLHGHEQSSERSLPAARRSEFGPYENAGPTSRDLQGGEMELYPTQFRLLSSDGTPKTEEQSHEECKPRYILRPRNCVSGEVGVSSPIQRPPKRSLSAKVRPWVSGEIERVSSHPYKKTGRVEGLDALASIVCQGLERVSSSNLRGANGDNKRRPSAAIAWDSLNDSREASPMRQPVVGVPFKWEEVPGTARRTMTQGGAERALQRKLPRKKSNRSPHFFEDANKLASMRSERVESGTGVQGGREETNSTGVPDPDADEGLDSGSGSTGDDNRDADTSRSSRRYYTRMSSRFDERSTSFDARSSNPDQVENYQTPHIDLVAPAAAKFLTESTNTVSPLPTPSKHALAVPFKWEEAPGKPKLDHDSAASAAPEPKTSAAPSPALQLPPRLIATVHKSHKNAIKLQESRPRSSLDKSMSAPVSIWYPTSNSLSAIHADHVTEQQFAQHEFSPRKHLQFSSSETHLHHSAPLVGWRERSKSSSEAAAARREASRMQAPWRTTSLGISTVSGPILRKPTQQFLEFGVDAACEILVGVGRSLDPGGKNLASWSPTSILDQRPNSVQSSVSDAAEVQQHSSYSFSSPPPTMRTAATTGPSLISNSTSQSSISQESGEQQIPSSSSEFLATPTTSSTSSLIALLKKKCRVKSPWPYSKLRSSSTNHHPGAMTDNAAHKQQHNLLQLSPSPEPPWCRPPEDDDACVVQTSEKTSKHQVEFHDCNNHESSATSKHHSEPLDCNNHRSLSSSSASPLATTTTILSLPVKQYHTDDNTDYCLEHESARHGSEHLLTMLSAVQYHREEPPVSSRLMYSDPVPPPVACAAAAAEQEKKMVRRECKGDDGNDAQQSDFFTCLGFPLSPARFLSKAQQQQQVSARRNHVADPTVLWVDNPSWVSPDIYAEDGYKSPAYTATLELLSPSADLMARRMGSGLRTRSLKLPRPAMMINKSLLVGSMCKSLKHTVLKCATQCCHKTESVVKMR